jgi:hypothetical protein
MTEENQPVSQDSSKEFNFRALENKYKRELEAERIARMEAEKKAADLERSRQSYQEDEDDDDDPYLAKKKFKKEKEKLSQEIKQNTQQDIQKAVYEAIEKERTEAWLDNNKDFEETMKNADKLVLEHPELAQQLLKMPNNFDRQKLVYYNIKKLGLDRPKQPQQTAQEKIDANRRTPYYQPSGIGNAPHQVQGDFSLSGQKAAYDKIQELKKNLRI